MKVPKISTVLAVSCAAGLVGSALLNMVQFQRSQQDKKLLQGEITDLRYELNLERGSQMTPTPEPGASPTPAASPSASPTPAPEVAGTASVTIVPYGLKLTVSGALADLKTEAVRSGKLDVAGFTTAALQAKYPKCTAGPALGTLVKRAATEPAPSYNQKMATFGAFSYYYSTGELSDCATDAAGKAAVTSARASLLEALKTSLSE